MATGDWWLRATVRIVAIRYQAVEAVRGGLPPSGDRWLRATGGYARQVATGHDEHWDRALSLAPNCPPAGPRIDARLGTISDHHEIDKTGEMIGDDGMCYSTEYPRQDSNRSKKPQGKRHVSKIVPPPVPPLASSMPPGASELLAIWSALDAHQQAELLRVARAMADHPAALDA